MTEDRSASFGRALRGLRRATRLPIAFGGLADTSTLLVTELSGVRTDGLRNIAVAVDRGLGGQVLAQRRPGLVDDYRTADSITHHYDVPVLAEGIRTIMAVPIMVGDSIRGVIYGAARCCSPIGDRVADAMVGAAAGLARELAVVDEVDRRVRALTATARQAGAAEAEEVRELHAELRSIAQAVSDAALRDRLRQACDRLADLGSAPDRAAAPALSPRELDVLAQVALGCTNVEVGYRLGLLPETVKAYLRSVMRKLDARTRYEAVVAARRFGLLP